MTDALSITQMILEIPTQRHKILAIMVQLLIQTRFVLDVISRDHDACKLFTVCVKGHTYVFKKYLFVLCL